MKAVRLIGATSFIAAAHAANLPATLPTGGQIVAGQGGIASSGSTMTVTQSSARMAVDWQSFSIGPGHAVNFVQPSATAVALNRVLGPDVSTIQGALQANGQVFLLNPNGVLFSPTAQVNVGGLVAGTLKLGNEDFLAGNYRFAGDSQAAVRNEGAIKVGAGGTAAFVAATIENTGRIEAPHGNVLMGAGQTVRLDLGGPVKIEVAEGALNAAIEQSGHIRADGGLVWLEARAAGDLAASVINHSGITEARSLDTGKKGEIRLMGDMARGRVKVGGTLDASAPNTGDGGFVETSAAHVQVDDSARVTTKAEHGQTGTWLIDPNDYTIAAAGGDMTGTTVSNALANNHVTIQSDGGATSGNGNIFVNDSVSWTSGNTLTLNAFNSIVINAKIDAGNTGGVALEYGQNGMANGNTASYSLGSSGKVNLGAGGSFTTKLGNDGATINHIIITHLGTATSNTPADLQGIGWTTEGLGYNYVLGADIDASATANAEWNQGGGSGFRPIGFDFNPFTGRFDGLGHTISNLTINRPTQDNVGLFGWTKWATIQNLTLADASITGKAGVGALAGVVASNAGSSSIDRVFVTHGSVTGQNSVGGVIGILSGWIGNTTLTNSASSAEVVGSGDSVGGLVGYVYSSGGHATISQSYAANSVAGQNQVGGLVGTLDGDGGYSTIENSYAIASVTGNDIVGGLVGMASADAGYSRVSFSYAAGAVSGSSKVGGLAGQNGGEIWNSLWDTSTTGQGNANAIGFLNNGLIGFSSGQTTQQMKTLATFAFDTNWNSSINAENGTGSIWRIHEGQSYPVLRALQKTLTVTANNATKTYDGTTYNGEHSVTYSSEDASLGGKVTYTGTANSAVNAGSHTITPGGLEIDHPNQESWQEWSDIVFVNGTLTIGKANATVTANSANVTYNGTVQSVTGFTAIGLVGNDTNAVLSGLTFNGGSGTNAGSYAHTVGVGSYDGNYNLSFVPGALTIGKASATVTANSANLTYNGAVQSVTGFTATGLVGNDTNAVLSGLTSSGGSGTNAGSYAHTVGVGSYDGNYALSFVPGALTIGKASAIVTANSANVTYNGTAQSVTGFTAIGLAGNDTNAVLSGLTFNGGSGTNAGSYAHTVGVGSYDGNYTLSFVPGALTIAKANATITANSANVTYNGATQSVTGFTATGLVGNDTNAVLSGLTFSGGSGTNAGSYAHTVGVGSYDGNYALSFVPGTLTIGKASATVTANSANVTYNGTVQSVTGFTTTGLVGNDTNAVLSGLTFSGGSGTNAGSYAHTVGVGSYDGNYTLSFVPGALTIGKANATVTANSANVTYNGAVQSVTGFTATGLVGNDTNAVLSGLTFNGGSGTHAGSYAHTVGAGSYDGNYTLSFVPGALTIGKANATVTANSANVTYNGAAQSVTGFTATGLVGNDTDAVLSGLTFNGGSGMNAGSYAHTVGVGSYDGNYTLSFVPGALTIAPRPIAVAAEAKSKTAGQADPALTYVAIGLVSGDMLAGALSRAAGEAIGAYAIGQGTVTNDANPNYAIAFTGANLNIAAPPDSGTGGSGGGTTPPVVPPAAPPPSANPVRPAVLDTLLRVATAATTSVAARPDAGGGNPAPSSPRIDRSALATPGLAPENFIDTASATLHGEEGDK